MTIISVPHALEAYASLSALLEAEKAKGTADEKLQPLAQKIKNLDLQLDEMLHKLADMALPTKDDEMEDFGYGGNPHE